MKSQHNVTSPLTRPLPSILRYIHPSIKSPQHSPFFLQDFGEKVVKEEDLKPHICISPAPSSSQVFMKDGKSLLSSGGFLEEQNMRIKGNQTQKKQLQLF
jgi:hypothetical protein